MRQRAAAILMVALSIVMLSWPVDQAAAMSFGHHHGDGGGASQNTSGYARSSSVSGALTSLDAPPYVMPVPEPTTVLLGSGVLALGLWRFKKKDQR